MLCKATTGRTIHDLAQRWLPTIRSMAQGSVFETQTMTHITFHNPIHDCHIVFPLYAKFRHGSSGLGESTNDYRELEQRILCPSWQLTSTGIPSRSVSFYAWQPAILQHPVPRSTTLMLSFSPKYPNYVTHDTNHLFTWCSIDLAC